jgi:sporulation protein YlmC with PRC-barrel domain
MAIENNATNPNWSTSKRTDTGTAIAEGNGERKYRRVMSAGTLAGDRVRNSAGEDLGKIEEIMIDVPTGRVAYAVLSFGGFLGMGDKLFALPWDALQLNEDEHEFILNVDKATLENAPGFDQDNWPDMADQNWASQIYGHYGSKPYWETRNTDPGRDFAEKRESGREKTFKGGTH